MFLIPVVILLAILAFSFSGDVIKSLNIDFSGVATSPSITLQEETKKQEQNTTPTSTSTPSKVSRAPPPQTQKPPVTPQAQQPPSKNSPYFQKIKISNLQSTTNNSIALITLRPNFSQEDNISITGWRIKSTWSGDFLIPLGIKFYHPNLVSQAADPVLVAKNDTVYLRGDANPLGRGMNYRPNMCFGYLKTYNPSLPGSYSCYNDKPKIEEIKHLIPVCQEFILNKIDYGSCKVPSFSSDPQVATNKECTNYINGLSTGFNYQGCYEKHSKDQNFLSSEWIIYMNTTFGNSLHDSIALYDQNGLIVDTYTY